MSSAQSTSLPAVAQEASGHGAPHRAQLAIRGDILSFLADPGDARDPRDAVVLEPDGWLLVDDGRVAGILPRGVDPGAERERIDWSGRLVMPGLIDAHVHASQLGVVASYGAQLLEWLNTYTFPAEARFANPHVAASGADAFVDLLLSHGTTSAVAFATVHAASVDALFAAARARGMRLVAGKVLMDRHAPAALLDDVARGERDTVDLIERWHGRERLAYAVTPRFAPTSSDAQLAMAGALCRAYPDVFMQTHVAENRAEVRWVTELFPHARSYLDVYARAGLLRARGVFAHGIWLDDIDRRMLADACAAIAFCPTSNLFLGSGLFDWRQASDAAVPVAPATDVGAGTSLSMLRTLAEGYKVQAMLGWRPTAWKLLHAATHGAAQALGLDQEIGSFQPGRMADVVVLDWAANDLARHRIACASDWHERLFVLVTTGDEQNVAATYVAGIERYRRWPLASTGAAPGVDGREQFGV